jgi:hypothetical protein
MLRLRTGKAACLVAFTATASCWLGTGSASATPLVRAFDPNIVNRVGQVVPLDASGSRIAFSASATGGKYIGDSVWVANGDGSALRRVGLTGKSLDVGIYGLTASSDGHWLAYPRSGGFVTDFGAPLIGERGLGIINVDTGALRSVSASDLADARVLSAPDGFYVVRSGGAVLRVRGGSGGLKAVPRTGSAPAAKSEGGMGTISADAQQSGSCDTVGRASVRLAVLDRSRGVLRTGSKRGLTSAGSQSCVVSDGGTTVASVAQGAHGPVIVALHDGRMTTHSVRSGVQSVVALSPTGRFALVQHGDFVPASAQVTQLVDLKTGRVRTVALGRGFTLGGSYILGGGLTAHVAWTTDESRVVLEPEHNVRNAFVGHLLLLDTASGRVRTLSSPTEGRGQTFEDGATRTRPDPIVVTDDGAAVIVNMAADSSETDAYPYRVPLDGGTPLLLLTSSVASYGGYGYGITRSADHSRAWLTAGWSCSRTYEHPLMFLGSGDPWASPWTNSLPLLDDGEGQIGSSQAAGI